MLPHPQHIWSQKIQERSEVKVSLHPVSNPHFAPLDHDPRTPGPYFYVGGISQYMMESKQASETSLFANVKLADESAYRNVTHSYHKKGCLSHNNIFLIFCYLINHIFMFETTQSKGLLHSEIINDGSHVFSQSFYGFLFHILYLIHLEFILA